MPPYPPHFSNASSTLTNPRPLLMLPTLLVPSSLCIHHLSTSVRMHSMHHVCIHISAASCRCPVIPLRLGMLTSAPATGALLVAGLLVQKLRNPLFHPGYLAQINLLLLDPLLDPILACRRRFSRASTRTAPSSCPTFSLADSSCFSTPASISSLTVWISLMTRSNAFKEAQARLTIDMWTGRLVG